MQIIEGKRNIAISYAKVIDEGAANQIRRMCDYEFTDGSKIRIMPDVHAGKGCTIGTTMTVTDKVVPNIVGVDIGCGMYCLKLAEKDIDLSKVDEVAHYIPSGFDIWPVCQEDFDVNLLRCSKEISHPARHKKSLGTLGGGNHFIEIDVAEDGTHYLVIHSGSRNLGKQVAEYYQQLAIDLNQGKEDYIGKRLAIIEEYKAAGRHKEIQSAIEALKFSRKHGTMPEELCFLYGRFLEDYLSDVVVCQKFALKNREIMAKIILEKCGLTSLEAFHTIHNYINTDEMILRKGAIAAHKGEKVLIPINMRDGSILAVGKGNPDWNLSAPHGAGRLMSRTEARNTLKMDDFKKSMEGIYTTSVCESTIDESPMAYKSIDDIIDVIDETVDVIEVLKPIYNYKASY